MTRVARTGDERRTYTGNGRRDRCRRASERSDRPLSDSEPLPTPDCVRRTPWVVPLAIVGTAPTVPQVQTTGFSRWSRQLMRRLYRPSVAPDEQENKVD